MKTLMFASLGFDPKFFLQSHGGESSNGKITVGHLTNENLLITNANLLTSSSVNFIHSALAATLLKLSTGAP